ncbi:hypothetical protein B0H34DRAFT_333317 [Crassisporium funariophilum]|nr:hypothetical protein B0H34DRAFT_333317 [Crassisporium funariophilum]
MGISNHHTTVGVLWDATLISYMIFGSTCCQAISYYRTFPKDSRYLKTLVGATILFEVIHVGFLSRMMWYYLIQRGIGVPKDEFRRCAHWTSLGQILPAELACLLVESFSVIKMWKFAEHRKFAFAVIIPFTVGWVATFVYCASMFKQPCYPDSQANAPYVIAASTGRFTTAIIIAAFMCFTLYRRGHHGLSNQRTLRLVNLLILWSLGTGFMMVLFSCGFLVTFLQLPTTSISTGIFIIRSRVYVSSMLTTLNDRSRLRTIADETIQLDEHHIDISYAEHHTMPSPSRQSLSRRQVTQDCCTDEQLYFKERE